MPTVFEKLFVDIFGAFNIKFPDFWMEESMNLHATSALQSGLPLSRSCNWELSVLSKSSRTCIWPLICVKNSANTENVLPGFKFGSSLLQALKLAARLHSVIQLVCNFARLQHWECPMWLMSKVDICILQQFYSQLKGNLIYVDSITLLAFLTLICF